MENQNLENRKMVIKKMDIWTDDCNHYYISIYHIDDIDQDGTEKAYYLIDHETGIRDRWMDQDTYNELMGIFQKEQWKKVHTVQIEKEFTTEKDAMVYMYTHFNPYPYIKNYL